MINFRLPLYHNIQGKSSRRSIQMVALNCRTEPHSRYREVDCSRYEEFNLWREDVGGYPIYTMADLKATNQYPMDLK